MAEGLYTLLPPGVLPFFQKAFENTDEYHITKPTGYIIEDRADDRLAIRRLQQSWEDVLSANELLQIALGKVDGFDKILEEYGVDFLATLRSVPQIVETLKISHIQATQLLAILALGRRVFNEPQAVYPVIRCKEDIFRRYRSMASMAKEQLVIALVNSRYLIVYDEVFAGVALRFCKFPHMKYSTPQSFGRCIQ